MILGECPDCSKRRKLYFNLDKRIGNCFACGFTPSGLKLVMMHEGVSAVEARAFIAKQSGAFERGVTADALVAEIGGLSSIGYGAEIEQELVDVPLPKEYQACYDKKNRVWRIPGYIKRRVRNRDTLIRHRIGYALSDRYADRAIVPIACDGARAFVARDMTGSAKQKYLNPKSANFNKLLYAFDAVKRESKLALVEGVFDSIRLDEYGVPSVAIFGKKLHDAQLAMLLKSEADRIDVMLDPEAQDEMLDAARRLSMFFDVRVCLLPKGADPGGASSELIRDVLAQAKPFDDGGLSTLRDRLDAIEGPGDWAN